MGKSTRRKHAHMHTQEQAGINVARADILLETFTLNTPGPTNDVGEDLEDDEPITAEEIEAEFAKLKTSICSQGWRWNSS